MWSEELVKYWLSPRLVLLVLPSFSPLANSTHTGSRKQDPEKEGAVSRTDHGHSSEQHALHMAFCMDVPKSIFILLTKVHSFSSLFFTVVQSLSRVQLFVTP